MKFSLKSKVIITIIIIAVVFGGSTGFIAYRTYSKTIEAQYKNSCLNLSRTIVTGLDRQQVELLKEQVMSVYKRMSEDNGGVIPFDTFSEKKWDVYYSNYSDVYKSDAYKDIILHLRELGYDNPGSSIYIAYIDVDTGYGIYLADGTINGDICKIGTVDRVEDVTLSEVKKGHYGFSPNITNYEQYGWLCTAGEEIRDSDNEVLGTLCVDICMDDVKEAQYLFLKKLCAVLFVVSVIITFVLVYLADHIIVDPINKLTHATAYFVSDKKNNGSGPSQIALLSIHSNDEIGKLCTSIKTMESDLNSYIIDLINVTAEKERIGAELYFDIMTGAMNRRYYEEQLCNACCQCIVSIDLDYFKKINDEYGHIAGDEVLISVVNVCKENIRMDDIIVRMGGDEFLIAFYKIEKDILYKKLSQIFDEIANLHFTSNENIRISLSAGCIIQKKFNTEVKVADLYRRVDDVLYKAKKDKNRFIIEEV